MKERLMSRGRDAKTPGDIPMPGWKDVALRLKTELASDHLNLVSAGVAFYALLATFPAITALVALAGLVLSPENVTEQLEAATRLIPDEAARIIVDQAVAVTGSGQRGLGFAFGLSLALAIYSASRGVGSLIGGLNVAYDETETRGFFKKQFVSIVLTIALFIGLVIAMVTVVAVPLILDQTGLPGWLATILLMIRWLILAALTILGLSVVYRFGPARRQANWQWVTFGAITCCVIWMTASLVLSIYVGNFGNYNETFGSMAGVIILLLWLWISAFSVLVGGALNAETEAQTRMDSTIGADRPMGERGAVKADNLGHATGPTDTASGS